MYPVCTYLYLLSSHLWLDDIYELLNLSTDLPQIMIGELSRTSGMFLDRVNRVKCNTLTFIEIPRNDFIYLVIGII